MSLKQECIDMIKLILYPLMQDDDDFYDVVTDEQVKFCMEIYMRCIAVIAPTIARLVIVRT